VGAAQVGFLPSGYGLALAQDFDEAIGWVDHPAGAVCDGAAHREREDGLKDGLKGGVGGRGVAGAKVVLVGMLDTHDDSPK